MCDRIYVMNEGKVAMQGTPREIFRRGDELRKIRLDGPVMVELREKLAAESLIPDTDALTVEEMAEEICPLLLKN